MIALLSFGGNGLFCFVITRHHRLLLRSPYHILIFSLAITDMLSGKLTVYIIIDLARAKSEALDNIYSLFKRRQRRRTVKNNSRSNWQKKQLCTCSRLFCTFLCRCFETSGFPLFSMRILKNLLHLQKLTRFSLRPTRLQLRSFFSKVGSN